MGKPEPSALRGGSRVASLLGRLAGAPQRKNWTDVEMLYDPGTSLLGVCPKEIKTGTKVHGQTRSQEHDSRQPRGENGPDAYGRMNR